MIDRRAVLAKVTSLDKGIVAMLVGKKAHDIGSYTSSRVYDGVRYMDPVDAVAYKARLRKVMAIIVSKNKVKRKLKAS
jgi:hypothetical protein